VSQHKRFHIKTLDQLRAEVSQKCLSIPVSEDLSVLGEPLSIGSHTAPNRFAVQPMEGFDSTPNGAPGPLSFRRYSRYAQGGFGLVWMEATAVLHEGRSNPGQLYLHKDNVGVFCELVRTMRQTAKAAFGRDIVIVIQLTHSMNFRAPMLRPRALPPRQGWTAWT